MSEVAQGLEATSARKIDAIACVGFRPIDSAGGRERRRILDLVEDSFLSQFKDYCITPDIAVEEGDESPFNRSLAKNNAADLAKEIDDDPDGVLVFTDADVYAGRPQVEWAVNAVHEGTDICLAHNGMAYYMAEGALRGQGVNGIFGPFPGGIFAIRRRVFESMGGWDNKFVGWGHEDLCFLQAADRIFDYKIMLSNDPRIGPFFKMDILHPRLMHEGELMNEPDTEAGRLYAKNTRRRDAYLKLEPGDLPGYWELRRTDII